VAAWSSSSRIETRAMMKFPEVEESKQGQEGMRAFVTVM